MCTRRTVVAVCLALATLAGLTACDHNAAGDQGQLPSAPASQSVAGTPRAEGSSPQFGRPYDFRNGLTVTISRPKPFDPSNTAHPRVAHAVSVEITIANHADQPYRLDKMRVFADLDGEQGREVVDSTQGYTGIADATAEVPASQEITLLAAFGCAEQPRIATLRIQPDRDTAVDIGGEVAG